MSLAEDLSAFLTNTAPAELPPLTMEHAAMILASTVASAAAGTQIDSARVIRELAREREGREDATVWFDPGPRLPLADAAQANAVASDAAASDDSDLRNIVHAGTPLSAVSLATAERTGASGEAVLAAIVLGYEAAGRISAAMTPEFRNRGFHGCHGAIFAATVAASRLLGLSAQQMAQAMALAATSIGGLITAADTSTSREYHAGLATALGVQAALAAQRGYQGELSILESPRGFFATIGGVDPLAAAASVTEGLGKDYDIVTDLAIKLAPGAHSYHSIGEAAAIAARDGDVAPGEVESISISRPDMSELRGPLHPSDLVTMAHSPAYFAAAGTADRDFSWAHASGAKIADPVIHGLIDKVRVGAPPPPEEHSRYRQGSTVTIHLRGGGTSTATVFQPKGSGSLGIDWHELDTKYRHLVPAGGLNEAAIEESLALIHRLCELPNVTGLTALLSGKD